MSKGSGSAGAHRCEVLDSLRGICACVVALFHLATAGIITNLPPVLNGPLFVDFFFVLSGFVISASYGARLAAGFSPWKFMGLRLGRIYPLHLAMLLVFLAFEILFAVAMPGMADRTPFTGPYSLPALGSNLLLLQTWIDAASWNIPSWSIAAEMWTYLIFSQIFRVAGRALVPICLVIAAVAVPILCVVTDRWIYVFDTWAIVRCLYGFSLGVVAFRLVGQRPPAAGGAAASLIELAMLALAIGFTSVATGPLSLAAPVVFFLVVLVFSRQAGIVSRVLLLRPFVFVGTLSYSIYMLHYFVQLRMVNALSLVQKLSHGRWQLVAHAEGGHNGIGGGPIFGDAMAITMLALVILGAWITYHLIEKPGQRWSRTLVLGARPRPGTVAAEAEAPTF